MARKKDAFLFEGAYETLAKQIAEMKPGENRLPREDEVAESLGVSRSTIREALKKLMDIGAVTKIQGKGNFAHPSIFKVENRVDLDSDFYKLLSQSYDDVELTTLWLGENPPSDIFKENFEITENENIYAMEWVYYAGVRPRIYGFFELPLDIFKDFPAQSDKVFNLGEFGKRYLKSDITYCSMELKCAQNEKAAKLFGVPIDTYMQCWIEKIYDINDNRVGLCKFFMHPEHMVMSIVTHFDHRQRKFEGTI